jgi:uncharacterized protein
LILLRVTGLTFLSLSTLFVIIIVFRFIEKIVFPDAHFLHHLMVPLCMVLVSLMMYRFYGKDKWTLGWMDKNAAGNFVFGAICSIILVSLASTVIVASSSIEVVTGTWDGLRMMNQILIILFATVGEEIFFRGYLFSAVNGVSNKNTALIINSLTFSIMYLFNSNTLTIVSYESIVIGSLNMCLLSILLSQARIYSGSIWMPIGLHFLFSVTQSTVFGYMYDEQQFESFFTVTYISHSVLNGGVFGIEASILWSPLLIISILCFDKIGTKGRALS